MWKGIEDLVREAVDPQFVKAVDKSNVLLGRVYDIAVQEAFDAVKSGRIGEMKKLTAKLGMKPLQILDMQTAKITWYGAYRQATEQFGLVGKRAVNYADDVVTKTQSSGTRSNISKIQRFALGRAAALFQTFVINDWNFLVKDVLALGRPEVSQLERFSKITKYIAATTAINIIYEDVLQMNSPYPTPIRVGIEALEAGEDFPSASYRVVRELAEQMPIIGGSIRYGTSPLGGVANIIEQTSEKLAGDKGQPGVLELFARFRGYPGTAQVAKWGRMSKKGEGLWPRLGGKPTIPFSRGTESFGFGEFGDFDTFD